MSSQPETGPTGVARFRVRLLVAMMLVVSAITAVGLVVAQHSVSSAAEEELQREFQGELAALSSVQELRRAALIERSRSLVRRPRIHAALEDNALDLLYPSAKDELRDVLSRENVAGGAIEPGVLHAEFYRFLSRDGTVIPVPSGGGAGSLSPAEEARLALPGGAGHQQLGYLQRRGPGSETVLSEIIVMPILSMESGEVIAALVLGFQPARFSEARMTAGITRGIWLEGKLHLQSGDAMAVSDVAALVTQAITPDGREAKSFRRTLGGVPHLLFCKCLNPGSVFPAAYEVVDYPLVDLSARQWSLRWRVIGAGTVLLLGALGVSSVLSGRLSKPVERLAVDSAENLMQRQRAEAALETTSEELQRAARFSADASHQLKTPVTVLRAGLEDLLARDHFSAEECAEIAALIHQTHRLSGVIEDLLLLSRMDAGRLKIEFRAVNFSHLIEAALDDLSAQPNPLHLQVTADFPAELFVSGEKRYLAIILQNLLENARKYNRGDGHIRLTAGVAEAGVSLTVANTGPSIPIAAQGHIFERFHRGSVGENVPGYGLGLNLARELARLHGGDLSLSRSTVDLTEFVVNLRSAPAFGGASRSPHEI